jgi:hypothetical protein
MSRRDSNPRHADYDRAAVVRRGPSGSASGLPGSSHFSSERASRTRGRSTRLHGKGYIATD